MTAAPVSPTVAVAQLTGLDGVTSIALRGGAGLPSLALTASTPGTGEGTEIRALWQADVALGAFSDLVGTGGEVARNVRPGTLTLTLSGGGSVVMPDGVGFGAVASHQAFTNPTQASLRASVDAAASSHGFRVVSVTPQRGITMAPAVVVRATSQAALGDYAQLRSALFGTTPLYEGYYLETRAADGAVVARQSAAFRTGAGRVWTDPMYTNVLGIVHGSGPAALVKGPGARVTGVRWVGTSTARTLRVRVATRTPAKVAVVLRDARGHILGSTALAKRSVGTRNVAVRLRDAVAQRRARGAVVLTVRAQAASGATSATLTVRPAGARSRERPARGNARDLARVLARARSAETFGPGVGQSCTDESGFRQMPADKPGERVFGTRA